MVTVGDQTVFVKFKLNLHASQMYFHRYFIGNVIDSIFVVQNIGISHIYIYIYIYSVYI